MKVILKTLLAVFTGLILQANMFSVEAAEELRLPEPDRFTSDGGIRAIYIEDELPVVLLSASFGYGSLYEEGSSAGMGECIAGMMELSGSVKYPGKKLHEEIESIGGELSVSSSWESFTVTVKVLARFADKAYDILSDLVKNPVFSDDAWEYSKKMMAERIRRSYDDPAEIAFKQARSIIFQGRGYGSSPAPEDVLTLKLSDAESVRDSFFTAGNMILGISSSISLEKNREYVDSFFKGMRPGQRQLYTDERVAVKKAFQENSGKVFFFEKEVPQATVVAGVPAFNVTYDGDIPLKIMNRILGGGSFNSRLMTEIRVKRGLAYSVQSLYRSRLLTGVFMAYAQTGPESVNEVVDIMSDNFNRVQKEPVEDSELNWTKSNILNSYVFNFDTPASVLAAWMDMEYNGLDEDYYRVYLEKVEQVMPADILMHSSRLFDKGVIYVVVGPASLREALSKGRVVVDVKEQTKE